MRYTRLLQCSTVYAHTLLHSQNQVLNWQFIGNVTLGEVFRLSEVVYLYTCVGETLNVCTNRL